MAGLELVRATDVHDFERRAGAFLAAREAEHNLMLGLCSGLKLQPARREPYFAVVTRDADVVGAALRTPPYNVLVSVMDDDGAIPLVVDDLARDQPDLSGVNGPTAESRRFAEAWTERTGRPHRLAMAQRIFRLEAVVPPTAVPGALRRAGRDDAALVGEWLRGFGGEALGEREDAARIVAMVDAWLQRPGREMYLWEDGQPVSMAGVSGATPNGIRVSAVYTPPALRGRGYASACVAAVSQTQLDAGRTFCFLFTDLANPTSNRIYQRIGYEAVCGWSDHRFD